jgi:signal transduction histidine kinase
VIGEAGVMPGGRRRWVRLWPRSLAWRTALLMMLALAVVQAAGLLIHAYDRRDIERMGAARELATRVMALYRTVVETPPDLLDARIRQLQLPPGVTAVLSDFPPGPELVRLPLPAQRLVRLSMLLVPLPAELRPRVLLPLWDPDAHEVVTALQLPDGRWLDVADKPPPFGMFDAPGFLAAFLTMTVAGGLVTLWAVRRLTAPVGLLADAADRLGRDVNALPLPERGPSELVTAAAAFNTMAARIRRFVQDRTFLLTAIGHDLRTPITRMKLRAEFIEDDELRRKFLADLDDLESMVSATLAFGRDVSGTEPVSALDLPALVRTVLDEAADAVPEDEPVMEYTGPDHLTVQARPMAIKRALANLVSNALAYGGAAKVRLHLPENGMVRVEVADNGPGVPPDQMDRVFEPFQRLESSRSRETGGTGLGLPIARNILRAHGGDVTLRNLPEGGLVAAAHLPA